METPKFDWSTSVKCTVERRIQCFNSSLVLDGVEGSSV